MLSGPFNAKAEAYFVQVANGLLVCLEPLEGMLHLPLSFPGHTNSPITKHNAHQSSVCEDTACKGSDFQGGGYYSKRAPGQLGLEHPRGTKHYGPRDSTSYHQLPWDQRNKAQNYPHQLDIGRASPVNCGSWINR